MTVKKQVFASKSERNYFYSLQRTWGKRYHIYHNLPFLNVFSLDNLIKFSDNQKIGKLEISEVEKSRLKKTSIDFTLCDEQDSPILSVEFDGIQNGFNKGVSYYTGIKDQDSSIWRKEITELKLKIAKGSLFPLFVVGYKQFQDFSNEIKLTIVDGIIGCVLSGIETQKELGSFSIEKTGISEEEFNILSKAEKYDLIQDYVIGVEVDKDFENNPVFGKRAELEHKLRLNSFSITNHYYPSFTPGDIDGFNKIVMIGKKIGYQTNDVGYVEGEAWLPNFDMPGFSGFGLTEDIAAIIALEKIRKLRNKNSQK